MPFESNTETGRIFVMKGSRRVLVKVVLFQLRGRSRLAQTIVLSSQTTFLVLATTFSHSLGLKYYEKVKIEKFQAFFNPAQAFQSFRLYHLVHVFSM